MYSSWGRVGGTRVLIAPVRGSNRGVGLRTGRFTHVLIAPVRGSNVLRADSPRFFFASSSPL